MNEIMKDSIVEMELAGMWAKIQSMRQTMMTSQEEMAALGKIADEMDKLRNHLAAKIEMSR